MFCPFSDDMELAVRVPACVKNLAVKANANKLSVGRNLTHTSQLYSTVDIPKRKILTAEEYDVNNANFTPQKSEQNDSLQWVHNMTDLQFGGLVTLCLVGPFLLSVGLTRFLQKREKAKHFKNGVQIATQFLRHVATYNKAHTHRFLPKLPGQGPFDIMKPLNVQYPPFQEPMRMGGNITWDNWRNQNMDEVQRALNRVNRITDKELAYFHHIYTKFPHVETNHITIESTLNWIISGQVTLDEARYQVVPKAAADELSFEDKKTLHSENWNTIRVSPEQAQILNEKSAENYNKLKEQQKQEALGAIKNEPKEK